ncbi:MAG: glutamate racemase [Brachymonas sp.]|nr:glutamate racemase [Brachymonas sp.]
MQHLPIGVFDSGVGGLSVLRALLAQLPHEDFVYLADTAWAPYGERSKSEVEQRSLQVVRYLIDTHHIKALVVACNTATAQAVELLRATWPHLPLVAIEPALKPATQATRTGQIGIMATQGTIGSDKFKQLVAKWQGERTVRIQACNGLALAIENALDGKANPDGETVESLCRRYTDLLRPFANQEDADGIDTLVLGCTHYPFASDVLQAIVGSAVQLVEPGVPVARQTYRLLQEKNLLRPEKEDAPRGQLTLLATAAHQRLTMAAHKWLGLDVIAKSVPI